MSRPYLLLASVSLLSAGMVPRLHAQRFEVAARCGYSAPMTTNYQLHYLDETVRLRDAGGPSIGTTVGYWPSSNLGVLATLDLHFTRHTGSVQLGALGDMSSGPADAPATQVLASLRFATRQEVGGRLRLGLDLGPAVIRFSRSEYEPAAALFLGPNQVGSSNVYFLAKRTAFGVAAGFSASYALTPRLQLSFGVDDFTFRSRLASYSGVAALANAVMISLQASARAL